MWWILACFVVLLIVLFYIWQNLTLTVAHICFASDRVEREFTVGLFSDLHAGFWLTDVKKLTAKQKFDMIALCGDVFDEKGQGNCRTVELVRELTRLAPCVYVKGNHEYRVGNIDAFVNELKNLGVTVLDNELCTLKVGDQQVTIAGLDAATDKCGFFHTAKATKRQIDLLRGLSRGAGVRLVLDHYPENFAPDGEFSYRDYAFEAMLSGHAHGGQVRLPFIGGLYAPGQGWLPAYTKGMYEGKNNRMIVSRGMGGRWYLPRVFNRVQIVAIHILPKQ